MSTSPQARSRTRLKTQGSPFNSFRGKGSSMGMISHKSEGLITIIPRAVDLADQFNTQLDAFYGVGDQYKPLKESAVLISPLKKVLNERVMKYHKFSVQNRLPSWHIEERTKFTFKPKISDNSKAKYDLQSFEKFISDPIFAINKEGGQSVFKTSSKLEESGGLPQVSPNGIRSRKSTGPYDIIGSTKGGGSSLGYNQTPRTLFNAQSSQGFGLAASVTSSRESPGTGNGVFGWQSVNAYSSNMLPSSTQKSFFNSKSRSNKVQGYRRGHSSSSSSMALAAGGGFYLTGVVDPVLPPQQERISQSPNSRGSMKQGLHGRNKSIARVREELEGSIETITQRMSNVGRNSGGGTSPHHPRKLSSAGGSGAPDNKPLKKSNSGVQGYAHHYGSNQKKGALRLGFNLLSEEGQMTTFGGNIQSTGTFENLSILGTGQKIIGGGDHFSYTPEVIAGPEDTLDVDL